MTENKSVAHRVARNAKQLREQRHRARQTTLSQYTIDELIEALKSRNISQGQALELEEFIYPLPEKD